MEKKSKRKRAIPARIKISNFVTVRIFPQKRLNALALEPGISPRNRKAKPNMGEKTIPVEVSGLNSPRSANGPTIADAIRLNRTAPKSGGKPAQRLNKAPVNAEWAMQIPRKDRCMVTIKTPTILQAMPENSPARIGVHKYSGIHNISFIFPILIWLNGV
jgi:hypothetical protein